MNVRLPLSTWDLFSLQLLSILRLGRSSSMILLRSSKVVVKRQLNYFEAQLPIT